MVSPFTPKCPLKHGICTCCHVHVSSRFSLSSALLLDFLVHASDVVRFRVRLLDRERNASELLAMHLPWLTTGDGTMKVKMQQMFGYPVIVMSEEVQCRKKTRGLLPGEQCPAGHKCSPDAP
jgi:hypothetical protein